MREKEEADIDAMKDGREPKAKPDAIILPRPIEQEIENLKRLLAHIAQRLDSLKSR